MIPFEKALQIVVDHKRNYGTEKVQLEKSVNRVLAKKWYADRDLPPFDRVTMDGIAILHKPNHGVGSEFRIAGIAAAGDPQKSLLGQKKCLEVMTGAVLPKEADTVIRYEDLTITNGNAKINCEIIKGQNIHKKGLDRKKGEILVSKGVKITGAEIGVAASIGNSVVEVAKLPKTIIISTGDELIEVGQIPKAHQIRMSNVHQVSTVLFEYGIKADIKHMVDDIELITKDLREIIIHYDLIIISGGVSKGKFDFIPSALENLGVRKHFHKVRQRPGKPFWFGSHENGSTIFALPGNPISSFMCAQVYLKEWLNRSFETKPNSTVFAILTEDVFFKPDITYFLEVKLLIKENGRLYANPQKGHGSGDLANLVDADAFIRLPQENEINKKGEIYPCYIYRNVF